MSKILDIDDLCEAALYADLPNADGLIKTIEDAATHLAERLADHLKIKLKQPAKWYGKEFAGLCASFGPRRKGQRCPNAIDELDPGGDWE